MDPEKENESPINKNVVYATLIVIVFLLVLCFIFSIIALFNSGKPGPTGAPGIPGPTGPQGDPGLPGRCDCPPIPKPTFPLPGGIFCGSDIDENNGNDNGNTNNCNGWNNCNNDWNLPNPWKNCCDDSNEWDNSDDNNNDDVIDDDLPDYEENPSHQNNYCDLPCRNKQKKSLQQILSNLDGESIMNILDTSPNDKKSRYFKNLLLKYQTDLPLNFNQYTVEEFESWVDKYSMTDEEFYTTIFYGNLNTLSCDIPSEPEKQYLMYILHCLTGGVNSNELNTLTSQQKLDYLTKLLSNYSNGNKKILLLILNEIKKLSKCCVNLEKFIEMIKNMDTDNCMKKIIDQIISGDNSSTNEKRKTNNQNLKKYSILTFNDYYIDNSGEYVFKSSSSSPRYVNIYIDNVNNKKIIILNNGKNITLRVYLENNETNYQNELIIEPGKRKYILVSNGSYKVSN